MDPIFEQIFNQTNIAIAYFNESRHLMIFNQKICDIWNINRENLNTNINVTEFFEILREKNVYPEKDDFKNFCNKINNYFGILEDPIINNLILYNNKIFEENIIPYKKGIIFIWEETTKIWEVTYNLNNYKNLYNRIIEKITLPTIVVGSNGLIEGYNLLFMRFSGLDLDFMSNSVHISDLIKNIDKLPQDDYTIAYLVGLFLSRKEFKYKINVKENNSVIEINGFPLPNGNNFILFKNYITNDIPNIDLSAISENFKQLQNSMILDLEQILNIPLNTIIGFADILHQDYLGVLNHRQKDYIIKIIQQAQFMKNELDNKIELSFYESMSSIEKEKIDLNEIIVNVMQQIKPKISEKNIRLNLNVEHKVTLINSNFKILTKLLTLTLLYITEQNNYNAIIDVNIKNPPLSFIIKDTSKKTIFSEKEISTRYDLNLILRSIELLNGNYRISDSNKTFRTLTISIN